MAFLHIAVKLSRTTVTWNKTWVWFHQTLCAKQKVGNAQHLAKKFAAQFHQFSASNFPHLRWGEVYLINAAFAENVCHLQKSFSTGPLGQCFSTGGPRPSSGPQSSFGGPPGFFYFVKNQTFRHKCHKNDKNWNLSATKSSRNNKMSEFYINLRSEIWKINAQKIYGGPQKCLE